MMVRTPVNGIWMRHPLDVLPGDQPLVASQIKFGGLEIKIDRYRPNVTKCLRKRLSSGMLAKQAWQVSGLRECSFYFLMQTLCLQQIVGLRFLDL
jgi:hypothetical protein